MSALAAVARDPVDRGRPPGWWRTPAARLATVLLAAAIWFAPVPEGLTLPAWRLFALFVATIFSVIVGALPILTASLFAVVGRRADGNARRRRPRTPASRTRPSC